MTKYSHEKNMVGIATTFKIQMQQVIEKVVE